MPSNFPTSPTVGQTYTYNSRTWIWDGSSWNPYLTSPSIKYGTYANLPATCYPGDQYYTTDSPYVFVATATNTWQAYFEGQAVTVPPSSSNFSWINQQSSTVNSSGGNFILYGNATTTPVIFKTTAPSTPYTIELGIVVTGNIANYCHAGFSWRSSSAGTYIEFAAFNDIGTALYKFNSNNSGNSTYTTSPSVFLNNISKYWFRASDDGTNRIASWSPDGRVWQQIHSVSRTDFLTANEVGIGFQSTNGKAFYVNVFHWKQY